MTDTNPLLLDHSPGRVRFSVRRCHECGRWWAYETFTFEAAECPVCTGRLIKRLRGEMLKRDRAIAALKGAVRRRKTP